MCVRVHVCVCARVWYECVYVCVYVCVRAHACVRACDKHHFHVSMLEYGAIHEAKRDLTAERDLFF